MLEKIIHFIKYNNATVIILAVILILGGGALAAGPEAIGEKQTRVEGLDNSLLLAADLDNFSMDFKIENIQADEKYYYATYSYLDLVLADNLWQYQLSQKTQKVSKKIREDIGDYLAKFLAKHYQARLRELKNEKVLAAAQGEQKLMEVVEYTGLIGKTLDLAAQVFPGYEAVKKTEMPTPDFNLPEAQASPSASSGPADNLTRIYNDYVAEHPEIMSQLALPVGGLEAPAEASSTPAAIEASAEPAIAEPESVEVIELPAPPAAEPEPEPESEPAPAAEAPAE